MDCLGEDPGPQIQGAVSQGEDMCTIAARTAELNIPGNSLETAMDEVYILATRNSLAWESVGGGQLLGASPNLGCTRSGVQTGVMNALEMLSFLSGLCRACLDQT